MKEDDITGIDEFRKIHGLDREEELVDYLGKEIRKAIDSLLEKIFSIDGLEEE